MASNYQVETVCLGVAIDHRLRRLMQPTTSGATQETGAHLSVLSARGREYGRSRAEIDVTTALAGPSTRGGIVVALQQPRDNHPFEKGVDAVINDCTTLAALDELFVAASCRTLSIRKNVSVIDLLPYVSEAKMQKMSDQQLKDSFNVASRAFCEKRPQVVLCAGKIWVPRPRKFDDRKGETFKIESVGIGKTFGNRTRVRLIAEDREHVPIYKVNGFHLSYAINYRPHYSCLRQLQLLTVVEACTQVRQGAWEDETWMQSLRDTCASVVERTSTTSSPKSKQAQGTANEYTPRKMFLPDYEKLYSAHLKTLRQAILSFYSAGVGSQDGTGDLYYRLLGSNLTTSCNDVSLILFEMSRLEAQGWDQRFDQWNSETLLRAAQSTLQFTVKPRSSAGSAAQVTFQLKTILNSALSRIDACVDDSGLDLGKASTEFLNLAIKLEGLLLRLLEEEIEELAYQDDREDSGVDLTAGIQNMRLGGRLEPVVQARPLGRRNVTATARA